MAEWVKFVTVAPEPIVGRHTEGGCADFRYSGLLLCCRYTMVVVRCQHALDIVLGILEYCGKRALSLEQVALRVCQGLQELDARLDGAIWMLLSAKTLPG